MPHRPLLSTALAGLTAIALLLAALPVRAADRDRLEAFLKVTGFDVALESIALAASDAPEMLGMEPGDFGYDWARVSREVFDTEKMHDTALDILSATLSDELLGHAAAFYATPLGQRLVEVENAAHRVKDDAGRQAEGAALLARSREDGDGRAALFRRMNAAVDGSGQSVRALQEIMVRFLMAASAAGVIDERIDEAGLRAMLRSREEAMRAEMRDSGLANAAYTYRDISTEDLETYTEALEDPKMQRVYELMNAIQYEIMAGRFEVLAVRMAEMHPGEEI